jgi:hypothetical protein
MRSSQSRSNRHVPVGLALGLLLLALASPAVVSGATPPFVAGRPITGRMSDANGCQGTAYGRVNGEMVIFTAWHCMEGAGQLPGDAVKFYDGRTLGWWGRDALGAQHDLAYVRLASGMIPTSGRNRVYQGRSEGADQWWTITRMPSIGCVAMATGDYWNRATWANYHSSMGDTRLFSVGKTVRMFSQAATDRCTVLTTNPWHGDGSRDSGTSVMMIDQPGTVWGMMTARSGSQLIATPMKDGLDDINWFYTHNGYTKGAYLCQTSLC